MGASVAALIAWPVRRPIFTALVLVALVLVGTAFLGYLPLERAPQLPGTALQVRAELAGIDAAQIEVVVVKPIEEALVSVSGLQEIDSRSRDGIAIVELRFGSTAERESALSAVRERVAHAALRLPAGMAPPSVERADAPVSPAAVYAVTSVQLTAEVIDWTKRELTRPLRELPEVAAVVVEGEDGREMRVQPDARRLAVLGLSFDDLIQALRGSDEAPRRGARRSVATSASAEVIAARAVRLPEGEPVALGEVAEVSVVSRPAAVHPQYLDRAALTLSVYPQTAGRASVVAERAHNHIAWLRANGPVPPGIEIHVLADESRQTRVWLKHVLRLGAACIVAALLATYFLFGRRTCVLTFYGFGVWLPLSAALMQIAGLALSNVTVAGWLFGCVPLVMIMARSFPLPAMAALVTAAMVLAWTAGIAFQPYAQAAMTFSLATLAAGLVGWLMTPWRLSADTATAPLARVLPPGWRDAHRLLIAATMLAAIVAVAAIAIQALPRAASVDHAPSVLTLRLHGESEKRVLALAEGWLRRLRTVPGLEHVEFSGSTEERWHLHVDGERLEQLDFSLADVGRALAIAGDGLIVSDIVNADVRLPIRLQVAPGVAGPALQRLLLRGEYKDQPAVYLRDVGAAERVTDVHERLRAQQQPAAEITARWSAASVTSEVNRLRSVISLPAGYTLSWKVGPYDAVAPEAE